MLTACLSVTRPRPDHDPGDDRYAQNGKDTRKSDPPRPPTRVVAAFHLGEVGSSKDESVLGRGLGDASAVPATFDRYEFDGDARILKGVSHPRGLTQGNQFVGSVSKEDGRVGLVHMEDRRDLSVASLALRRRTAYVVEEQILVGIEDAFPSGQEIGRRGECDGDVGLVIVRRAGGSKHQGEVATRAGTERDHAVSVNPEVGTVGAYPPKRRAGILDLGRGVPSSTRWSQPVVDGENDQVLFGESEADWRGAIFGSLRPCSSVDQQHAGVGPPRRGVNVQFQLHSVDLSIDQSARDLDISDRFGKARCLSGGAGVTGSRQGDTHRENSQSTSPIHAPIISEFASYPSEGAS